MLRSKSKSVQCWQYLHAPTSNIATQPNFLATSWKKCVEKSRRQFNLLRNMLLQLARKKFWCVTIFEVGGNTVRSTTLLNLQRNNVRFASFSNLLLVLLHSSAVRAFSRNARHRFPDIGSTSTSAVWFVFQHYLRRTRNVYCTYWELILYVEGRNRGLHGILTSSLNDLERYQIYSSFMT